jgi:predicted DNA-binding protein (MmcQ/YjbR family)
VGDRLDKLHDAMMKAALAYPGAFEDHPWGDTVVKVGKKIFLFIGEDEEGRFGFSVKLPESADAALSLGFTEPTGYGLGKAGWVTARIGPKDNAATDVFLAWLDESYRAVAPAKLLKQLDAAAPEPGTVPKLGEVRRARGVRRPSKPREV